MPAKSKNASLSKKQVSAAKTKVVEDKTFGLKNKNKSKKVQAYVQQVAKAADQSFTDKKKQAELDKEKMKKEARKKHKEEMADLFKVAIIQPKVPFGVDPKTIACAFFKAGQCKKKGDACKFSHDQEICFGKKKAVGNSIDLTCDVKSKKKGKDVDEEAITDPEELKRAIEKKAAQMKCETHIICKHFLEAIESKKYGWFWNCPDNTDGKECKYRHALPEGYVFKSKKGAGEEDEEGDGLTMEEKLDEMRKGLGPGSMPVTKETFKEWKDKREKVKAEEAAKKEAAAQKTYKKGGKTTLTGKQLFEFDASIFVDDIDAGGADSYKKEFEDVADMEQAKAGGDGLPMKACEEEEAKVALPEKAAIDAAVEALPEGIEENLFLDEDLDDLPSDDD